jgi:hypothetical protein
VNADLTPALIAAGGGAGLLGGIWLHERRQREAMRSSLVPLGLRFPLGLDASQAQAALDGLAGLPGSCEIIAEVAAREGVICHRLWIPDRLRSAAEIALLGSIPSLRISEAESGPGDAATLALKLFVPTPTLLSQENVVAASRSLLTGLAALRGGEQVLIRLCLRPARARVLTEPEHPTARQRDVARAWQRKAGAPGFTASGLVLVRGSRPRARALATQVESVLRSRRGLAGGLRITSERSNRRLNALPRTSRSSGWLSGGELLALLGWPLGSDIVPGVEVGAARQLPADRSLPRSGRRLFIGRDASGERPVALSAQAARHHVAMLGPSGVGKSELLGQGVLSDIEQGYAGLVIDPKDDLVAAILDRVRPEHAERVVVLEAGDDSRPVPGIDVLHSGDPDACADILIRTFKAMFPDWGIRSETYGRLALRTLAEVPGASLLDMGRLFAEEPFRRDAVARLSDPYLLGSWQGYETLSPAAKADVVQAPMSRVMALLARPRVRAVLASPQPKLDLGRLFAERKFLLVALSPGALGAAAPLIGAAVMFAAWSAVEARVKLPPHQRHLINLYVDEFSTVASGLPGDFEQIAERARGLGASLTIAAQTLGRIPEPARSALLGNAASFITFSAPPEDGAAIARQLPGLSAQDVESLGRFEVAARLATGTGRAVSVLTGRTEPLPPQTGQAEAIRDRSAKAYGAPAVPIVPHAQDPATTSDADTVGVQRRRP